jgi:hypothetical protein
MKEYVLDGDRCVSACLVSGSCPVDMSKILPLPASLSLIVWCGLLVLLRYVSFSYSYMPYAIMAVSGVIELAELIACLLLSKPTTTRLLL